MNNWLGLITMDIQTLAALGEFIGGIGGLIAAIAVVCSLIFVGIQLRASVRQASVDSYSTITGLWLEFTNATAASEEAWQVFHQGIRDYDSLSDVEKSRFNFLIGMYFGILDTIMVHEDLGVWKNPETYRRSLDEMYRLFRMPGVQSWWQHYQGRVFAPRVEEYLRSRSIEEAP
jgi:hypothetical protein